LIASLDAAGNLCLFSSATTHLTADVVGYLPAGTDVTAITPTRLLDTRASGVTIDGVAQAGGKVPSGSSFEVQIAGRGGVAADATSAVINITAVNPEAVGFVTVHPCVSPRPLASSLNYVAGVNGGNEIITQLSATGTICVYTDARTHLTADVVAYTN
jgi:hypothetical protein